MRWRTEEGARTDVMGFGFVGKEDGTTMRDFGAGFVPGRGDGRLGVVSYSVR